MVKRVITLAVTLLIICAFSVSHAEESVNVPEPVRVALKQMDPVFPPQNIQKSEISGLYEARIGPTMIYISDDGKYLMNGELFSIGTQANITREKSNYARKDFVYSQIDEKDMIVYEPKGEAKYEITVFTDVTCPYCKKLHGEIEQYLSLGFRVRYVFYPREGESSDSYVKSVSIWCSDNRKNSLTKVKSGGDIPKKECNAPVKNHLKIGNFLRIPGTPAILLDNGELVPSYVPADKLASAIDLARLNQLGRAGGSK